MRKKFILYWSLILLLATFLIQGCTAGSPAATPTKDAQAVLTQAAEAVFTELTQAAALTPSVTPAPKDTATVPPIPTLAATAVQDTATPAATMTNTVPAASGNEQAELVSQTVADKSTIPAGQSFKETWTLKNTGSATWMPTHALKWFSGLTGDSLTIPNTVNLANQVKPGETIDVSVSFTAPKAPGAYHTVWYLQNTLTGANFLKLSLEIEVANLPTSTLTPTTPATATLAPPSPTPTVASPTATPTP